MAGDRFVASLLAMTARLGAFANEDSRIVTYLGANAQAADARTAIVFPATG